MKGFAMAKTETTKGWKAADDKWTSKTGKHGYSVLPNILFWYAAELKIKPPQQAVLFHLLSRWWFADNPPVVSKAKLAEGLGITERQVQRHLRTLEKAGLIESRFPKRPGRHPNEYTFDGLVSKLQKMSVAYDRKKRQQDHGKGKAVRSV